MTVVDSSGRDTQSTGSGSAVSPESLSRLALIVPALLLVLLALYIPLIWLLTQSFNTSRESSFFTNYSALVRDDNYLRAYGNSLWLAIATAAIVTLLAYPSAYVLSSLRPRVASVLFIIVLVPFWTSLTVTLFAFQLILGRQGLINKTLQWLHLIDQPISVMFTATSVIVGFVYVGLPLMILPLYAVMRRIDRSLVSAARTLGATPRRAFFHVFFPLSLPGVVAGVILVFVTTAGYFIVPQLLGGQSENTVGQFIVHEVKHQQNIPQAGALTVGLIGGVIVFLAIVNRFMRFDRALSGQGGE